MAPEDRNRPAWAERLRKERRNRLWSQEDMAKELEKAADKRLRQSLPARSSVVRRIRDYEAGKHQPRDPYRLLYCRVFAMDEAELYSGDDLAPEGPENPEPRLWAIPSNGDRDALTLDDEDRLIQVSREPRRLDAAVLDSLALVLSGQRRTEDMIGSAAVIEPVRAQVATVENLLTEARGKLRSKMLDIGGQWAQFAGWLNASTGHFPEADQHYDRALQWATEAGKPDMIATALSMKGHLAWQGRLVGPMIGLSQAAQRDLQVSDGVRALAVQQEARGLALAGEVTEPDRKLDEALALTVRAAERPEDQPPWIYFFSPEYLTLQRGLVNRYLGRHQQAAEWLTRGLDAIGSDTRSTEYTARYVLQLAVTHLAMGDITQACATATEAAVIARQTHSELLSDQLLALHSRMIVKWPNHPAVVELGDRLR